jgi:phosphatidate cytidylyltransferase
MLLSRILTAIALAVPVVWIILFQPVEILFYLLLLVVFLSGFEWSRLAGVESAWLRLVFALLVTALPWIATEYFNQYVTIFIGVSVVWWFGVYLYLKQASPVEKGSVVSPVKLLIALLVIPTAVLAMLEIQKGLQGGEWLLYSMMMVWVADIGAYFSGKRFGRRKLAANISPGKTREGLWGGMVATTLYSLVAAFHFELDLERTAYLIVLSLLVTVISVTGDLYESFLKRERGLKDSGKLLPGHGGILDRIDGVLAAMPVFYVGYSQFISSTRMFSF